jgi:hypothetical protein
MENFGVMVVFKKMMVQLLKVNGKIINYTVLESVFVPTIKSMWGVG